MGIVKNFNNLDTDNTLGGNSPSDYRASSQKAIKEYVDNSSITIDSALSTTSTNPVQNKVITTALDDKIENTATGSYSTTLGSTHPATVKDAVNVGSGTYARATRATALGRAADAKNISNIAIGYSATTSANYAIQLGTGTNSTANTFSVGFDAANTSDRKNWILLDGTTGKIPNERLNVATVATSGSYNDLSNKPTIPSEVTESTVSGWGFIKNSVNNLTNYYTKAEIDNIRKLIEFKKPTSSSPSWYNLYSDGFIEQGGEITIGTNKTGQITFSKEFENNKYMPILTCITYTAGNIDGLCHITELTTTGMKIFDASGRTYRWECKGYINNV